MSRNIRLSYLLAIFSNTSFWIGIWLLYYLKFTNYTGVGIIETTWVLMSLLGEIPTGALADLLGKKYTLILAFLFNGLGNFLMAHAHNFPSLFISVLIWSIGGILQSGAYEALIYDSLKENHQEKQYNKILANTQTLSLITMALASVIGGFIYQKFHNGYPFLLTGIFYFLALVTSFLLKEPTIDTDKFSWSAYLHQTKQGITQLFKKSKKTTTIILLVISALFTILYESVGDALIIEFGFRDQQLGIFYAFLFIIAALSVQLAPWFKKKFGTHQSLTIIGLITSLTLMVSPFIYLFWGGITTYLRASFGEVINNITSTEINQDIPSKYRATTLSTFNMLKLLPYALSAILVGHLMDLLTAKVFAFYFGFLVGFVVLFQHFFLKSSHHSSSSTTN